MSDSGDDFGGLGATTPNRPRKPQSRDSVAVAGPSRTTSKRKNANVIAESDGDEIEEVRVQRRPPGTGNGTAATKRRRKEQNPEHENEDDPDDIYASEERPPSGGEADAESEEVQVVENPPKKAGAGSRKPTSRTAASTVNGRGTAGADDTVNVTTKTKGKAKAKPATAKASSSKQRGEPMNVETINLSDDDEGMEAEELMRAINAAESSGPARKAAGVRPPPRPQPKQTDVATARLKEQIVQLNSHIEDLKRQLEELHKVRKTEAELLLERVEAQSTAEKQASEALIKDLTEQLQRKDPLLRSGKNGAFEILTREEANRENHALREQVKSYKDALQERDKQLKETTDDLMAFQQSNSDLRHDLGLEIERGKSLAAKAQKHPSSATRPGRMPGDIKPNEDPKLSEIVKFYEDLTNVLVPNIKALPGRYLGKSDWELGCIYSYQDVVDKSAPAKSLNFTLKLCHEPRPNLEGEPKRPSDLVASVQYTPHSLEKETEEFVESLDFLKTHFTFERSQLELFMRTLHDAVSGDGKAEEPEGSDDDVQMVA